MSKKFNMNTGINDVCRSVLKKKEEAFKRYKKSRLDELYQEYKVVRKRCKTVIKRKRFLHNQKIRRKILEVPVNYRSFWSFAKVVKNDFSESSYLLFVSDIYPNAISDSDENVFG
jgi:hypothetical protein